MHTEETLQISTEFNKNPTRTLNLDYFYIELTIIYTLSYAQVIVFWMAKATPNPLVMSEILSMLSFQFSVSNKIL